MRHVKIMAVIGILVGIAAAVLGIVSLTQTMQSLGTNAAEIIRSNDQ